MADPTVATDLASAAGSFVGTAATTLAGGVIGAVTRLAPEVIKIFTQARDQKHELEMTKLQIEREKQLGDQKAQDIQLQADAAYDQKGLDALIEAIKGQETKTGNPWVDAVSATVRPTLTYWIFSLYSLSKFASFMMLWSSQGDWKVALSYCWNADDMAILSATIAFWFLDRTYRKR